MSDLAIKGEGAYRQIECIIENCGIIMILANEPFLFQTRIRCSNLLTGLVE